MSKNNHLQVEALIRQAISACSYDSALSETKSYLAAALNMVNQVSTKRSRRVKEERERGPKKKTQQQIWWEMLKKNAANNIDLEWSDNRQSRSHNNL